MKPMEQIRRLEADRDVAQARYVHLINRREELAHRALRPEKEHLRDIFIRRIDGDISDTYRELIELDANLEGLGG